MTIYYTGIGSRNTPKEVLTRMTRWARTEQAAGHILRSGAAAGADTAFEKGAGELKEIWLPWRGFRNHPSILIPEKEAFAIAESVHPAWSHCNSIARKFHARNVHLVLGADLETPSSQVVCWTPKGRFIGGTATAMRLAVRHGIPLLNLAEQEAMDDEDAQEVLEKNRG